MTPNTDRERPPDLQERPEWKLVQRIVASRAFAKSQRLRSLLIFISERAIQGRESEISEQQIGVQVFERASGFNSSEDSIVRSHVRLLRQRLELYFREEGAHEALRMEIPKGAYTPVFEVRPAPAPATVFASSDAIVPAAMPMTHRAMPLRIWIGVAAAAIAIGAAFWLGRTSALPQPPPPDPLWSLIFDKGIDTIFVSADNGLVMYQNIVGRHVSLAEYTSREYRAKLPADPAKALYAGLVGFRRYTTILDVNFVLRLTRLPDYNAARFQVRYARDLDLSELKRSNAILSGAHEANPWVELFEPRMNFVLEKDQAGGSFRVINRKPQAGEAAEYAKVVGGPSAVAFGHIALFPSIAGPGRVLIAEGTGAAGTEAAFDLLLNNALLRPLLNRIRGNPNAPVPSFEILLATRQLEDSRAPQSEVIAYRSYR